MVAGNGHLLPMLLECGARADVSINVSNGDADRSPSNDMNDQSKDIEASKADEKSATNTNFNKKSTYDNAAEVAPLLIAAREQDLDTVQLLLSRGADPNPVERFTGYTPIFYTVQKAQSEVQRVHKMMELLIDNGASVSLQDCLGMTPLTLACNHKYVIHLASTTLREPAGLNI